MIALWGIAEEAPLAMVGRALVRLGAAPVMIDQRDVLQTEAELSIHDGATGWIRTPAGEIRVDEVTAAYVRPQDIQQLLQMQESEPTEPERLHAMAIEETMLCWLDATQARVVNPPSAGGGNESKPYQVELIRKCGFSIPETLVTTDAEAVRELHEQFGTLIYKSVSSVRSRVSRLDKLDDRRLANLRWCPTQFQRYVRGIDYRVHVVGGELFACEIRSPDDDYRYPADPERPPQGRAAKLPPEVEDCCRSLAVALALPVAGIDLRRTPEGEWFCFEVNPSPGFSFFEWLSGAPIADAIARLLVIS